MQTMPRIKFTELQIRFKLLLMKSPVGRSVFVKSFLLKKFSSLYFEQQTPVNSNYRCSKPAWPPNCQGFQNKLLCNIKICYLQCLPWQPVPAASKEGGKIPSGQLRKNLSIWGLFLPDPHHHQQLVPALKQDGLVPLSCNWWISHYPNKCLIVL